MKDIPNQVLESDLNALVKRGTDEVFLGPMVEAAHSWNRKLRQSSEGVSDEAFLKLGVHRVLRNNECGRDFLQTAQERLKLSVQSSAFFDLFHSPRRLKIVEDTAAGLYGDACRRLETDLLKDFPQLEGMDVIAGDGHLLAAACHAKRDTKGRKVASNSLFMLNVRNGLIFPLAAVQGNGEYGHELPVLRSYLPDFLQQQRRGDALKKVLMLLDPAFIDTVFWTNFGHARKLGGLVIIPEKSGLNIYHYETVDFDRNDPVNTGVLSCELVGFEDADSATAHRIVYRDPETGKTYSFLTTATDLPPGLVALLYLLRWRIEKIFDVFKNKLHESKTWGNGRICQLMQAHFVCMTHNLMTLLSDTLKHSFGIEPMKLYRKREKHWLNERKKRKNEAVLSIR